MISDKTPLSLRIVVVGGSISGLAAAYALQRAGHRVVVLEKTDGQSRCRSNMKCPPNMVRILDEWNLEKDMANVGQKCTKFVFQKGTDAELLSVIPLHAELLQELQANFVRIEHGDIYTILLKNAIQSGAEVRFNSTVTSFDFDPPNGGTSAIMDTGEAVHADLIVGADGPNSMVRDAAFDQAMDGEYQSYIYLNYTGPLELFQKDEEMKQLAEEPNVWQVWLGPRYMAYLDVEHYGSRFSLSVLVANTIPAEKVEEFGESWKTAAPPSIEDFGLSREQFEPRILRAMDLATEGITVGYQHRPPMESLVGDYGSVVLVGEAAHPMPPNAMHVAALCIEDAEVLGRLFSYIRLPKQIPSLLGAYEDLRLAQHAKIFEYESGRQVQLTLPDGPYTDARNGQMQKSLGAFQKYEELDEETFNELWGEEVSYFVYDAKEVVDDWYSKWGSALMMEKEHALL